MCKKDKILIYCADIGSELNSESHFAWANNNNEESKIIIKDKTNLKLLSESIIKNYKNGYKKIAIGFECPLFFEVKNNSRDVTKKRTIDDKIRSWSAGAGAQSLVTGLAQITWLLKNLKENLKEKDFPISLLTSPLELLEKKSKGIFIWEAFISNKKFLSEEEKEKYKKSDEYKFRHLEDAKLGVEKFCEKLKKSENEVEKHEEGYFSIVASIISYACSEETSILRKSCYVLKEDKK